MRLPEICIIKHRISDLLDDAGLNLPTISELRKQANILVIDDNEFPQESYLRSNGYRIIRKKDISAMTDVAEYDIILCDITGVGIELGFSRGGASIIKEIRKNYPCKLTIAYTAHTYEAAYNQFFALADFVAPKDFSTDDWIEKLDELINKSVNPINQWERMRDDLLKKGVSTLAVAKIEDKFVNAIKSKKSDKLNALVKPKESTVGPIISDFLSSLCAKIIISKLGG